MRRLIVAASVLLLGYSLAHADSPETKQARVNGVNLTYQDQGEGKPVVFVHGAGSDYRVWDGEREAMRDHLGHRKFPMMRAGHRLTKILLCAWVLWTARLDPDGTYQRTALAASWGYDKREACAQAAANIFSRGTEPAFGLPGTVYPRGPKGK